MKSQNGPSTLTLMLVHRIIKNVVERPDSSAKEKRLDKEPYTEVRSVGKRWHRISNTSSIAVPALREIKDDLESKCADRLMGTWI